MSVGRFLRAVDREGWSGRESSVLGRPGRLERPSILNRLRESENPPDMRFSDNPMVKPPHGLVGGLLIGCPKLGLGSLKGLVVELLLLLGGEPGEVGGNPGLGL